MHTVLTHIIGQTLETSDPSSGPVEGSWNCDLLAARGNTLHLRRISLALKSSDIQCVLEQMEGVPTCLVSINKITILNNWIDRLISLCILTAHTAKTSRVLSAVRSAIQIGCCQ